jgi:hypothetical protein
MLLINKFRNKFHVNPTTESGIDSIIKDEVANLLAVGTTVDTQLSKLDKKLNVIILKERKNTTPLPTKYGVIRLASQ